MGQVAGDSLTLGKLGQVFDLFLGQSQFLIGPPSFRKVDVDRPYDQVEDQGPDGRVWTDVEDERFDDGERFDEQDGLNRGPDRLQPAGERAGIDEETAGARIEGKVERSEK